MSKQFITLGGGCFWCVEAVFEELEGVLSVESGYMGGRTPEPTYEEVCSGKTGHVEVVQVTFDASITPLKEILQVFFATHDPTTLNRQGNDVGTQYRSVIFYCSDAERETARQVIQELTEQKVFDDPIVTALEPEHTFYPAEAYHQHYFRNHPNQGYCQVVVAPKVQKFRKKFAAKWKH